ncbi:4-hydroxy-tetrahydrodipicolinate synthase [Clostridiales bacterium]|nr:4-hydroxy-tetrahydrodipicolinate synthase [Eubacterium sp.]GFI71573.1 4-hydroxy-tetrahydrodipicolinate synthase [Clostridiales bacterium]
MKEPIFTGAAVAIITPMNEDGTVNYDEFAKFVDWQLENGTDAIVICGTTGESSTLEVDEHIECIRWCINYVNGRCKVIAGTGSNSTASAIEMSKEACEDGADALLLVTPYYNKTSQRGLIAHYKAIHDATDKPIILYNVPSRTGVNILPETAAEIAKLPRVNGIKEASGNLDQIAEINELCGDELNIWSGNDDQIVDVLERGGKGVISVLSNVCPQETHDIVAKYLDGDTEGSKALMDKYMKLAKTLFCDVNPIPVKEAVNMLGFNAGHCRLPLIDMTDENKALMKTVLEEYKLIK